MPEILASIAKNKPVVPGLFRHLIRMTVRRIAGGSGVSTIRKGRLYAQRGRNYRP